ncbi:MAG: hypothetical protein KJ578_10840 [Bacteroidetes bacterium]|nr:hypothetical protein [Bacteroidota bacterium]MBU1578246.1 hypothetical protein [Bacteroidota bacterium]MBU2466632.1 hypothetical protein [Bacteroidota bacterium]MBU2558264.1 hypothetical protein [Bacteroidota bacterium]
MSQIRILKQSLFVIFLLVMASACTYDFVEMPEPDPIDPTDTISFQSAVAPIFSDGNKCTACHSTGETAPDLTPDRAYNALVPAYVNLQDPEASAIYWFTHPQSETHSWKKYSLSEANIILGWIQQGAQNN